MKKMLYKKIIVSAILVFSICIGIFPIMSFESFSLDSQTATLDTSSLTQCTTPEEYICFSSDNSTYFPKHSVVNLTYIIVSDSEINELTKCSKGISINCSVENENNKRINVNFICGIDYGEGTLTINIELKNGNNYCVKLFILNTEQGVFISPISNEEVFNLYLNYQRCDNFLTEDEIQRIKNNSYKEFVNEIVISERLNKSDSEISTFASTAGSGDTCLVSYLTWQDKNGSYHSLIGAKVEVYDDDGNNDDLLATLTTNSSGMITFYFNNPDRFIDFENGGYDLYLKVFAGDTGAMVHKASDNSPYVYYTDVLENVSTGQTHIIGLEYQIGSELNKVFQISQAVITARNYTKAMGYDPTNVKVTYPHVESDTLHTCYDYSNDTIKLCEYSAEDLDKNSDGTPDYYLYAYEAWDTIMHEYAHHLEYELNLTNNVTGSHNYGQNLVEYRSDKFQGISIAWAEGWANAFSLVAQDYYESRLSGIAYVADSNFNSYNMKSIIDVENAPTSVKFGEASEWGTTALLWDLFDGTSENGDNVVLLHQAWWNITATYGAKTFNDFIIDYYGRYNTVENKIKIGELLSNSKFAPKIRAELCENGTSTDTPYITWQPGGKGNYNSGGNYYNIQHDVFLICFYDDDYNLIFSEVINDSSRRTYKVSQSNWNLILNSCVDKYTICVAGKDTDSFTTGYYYSGGLTYQIP